MKRLLGYAIYCAQSDAWYTGPGQAWEGKAGRLLMGRRAAYAVVGRCCEPMTLRIVKVSAVRKPVVVPTQITTEEQARAFNALEPKPAPVVNPPCWSCGLGVEPGPEDDCLTDGERVKCGSCGLLNYVTATDDGVSMSDPNDDEDDEPKPAPVVAGERYACMEGCFMWLSNARDSGTRAEAEARAVGVPGAEVVRILPDGEHEAAIAQAREESRLSGLAEARSIVKAHKRTMTPRTPSDSALGAVLVTLRDAAKKGSVK